MSDSNVEYRKAVQAALLSFSSGSLANASTKLLKALGYTSEKSADLGGDAETLLANIENFKAELGPISREKVKAGSWKSCAFLFQITNDEIPTLAVGQAPVGADSKVARGQIESFVFLAIDLKGEQWPRSDLANIARELNRRFPMPGILIFRHGSLFSLAVIDRRQNLRDASRDVIDSRITVIKDVRFASPHRAHVDILCRIALGNFDAARQPSNFRELYDAWIEALSTQSLNKRFYTDLAWWYFWAVKQVDFPVGGGKEIGKRNSVAVIRLLTRLIFIWFIKEKGLVPESLFDRPSLKGLLNADLGAKPDDSTYYLAVLQNLFFATLNSELGVERKWAQDGGGMKGDRMVHSLYRHRELFKDPTAALKLFATIPYLNGGLFECLDRELTERDFQRNPELRKVAVKEGNGWVLRVDGFSRRTDAQPTVPNKIFFGGEENVDLESDLGPSRRQRDVLGLIDLFGRYKFTVDENTPIEEEVALDPELLGKVFENLLASYNEDTKSTARKQSGSFYTPREVVDYMVDEALVGYFERHIPESDTRDGSLRQLLSYTAHGNPFGKVETGKLIAAIEALKILDPACGSGAFPMGVLTKLVHVLKRLDPSNALWRAQNLRHIEGQLELARKIPDPSLREAKIEEAESSLEKTRRDFENAAHADYTRKLYLIEKCIHGVDIQPIAVQIAKLRFFIALVVSQEVDPSRENFGITALPNLETKIVAADSLTPIDRPVQLGLRDPSISQKEVELTAANEHYFAARTAKTKRKWRDRIFLLRDELAALLEEDRFLPSGSAKQLVHWNPFDQNAAAEFFDPEWMFQLADGFDITIGNPPYVRQEEIKHLKENLKVHFECYSGTADLYIFFYERAVRLLKPGGAFAFITSNKWYRAKYGEKLREWMNRNTQIRRIIDFGDEPVFTAIAYPTIVVATRRKEVASQPAATEQLRALNWTPGQPVESFPAVFSANCFAIHQAELKKEGWQLEPPGKRRLLARIRSAGTPLGEYVNGRFYYGIKTGLNEAFVIDATVRARLIAEDPRSAEVIKPYLRGRDIKRWWAEPKELWLIYIPWHFPLHLDPSITGASSKAEAAFKREFPAVFAHLSQFKRELEARNQSETGIRYEWYALQRWGADYWREFEQPKIIYPDIYLHQSFAWDTKGYYPANTCYFIPTGERWLTGLLNAPVIEWFYEQIANRIQNGYLRAFSDYMQQVPIATASTKQREIIDACVCAALHCGDSRIEQLINGLVFELYFPDDLHDAKVRLFDACEEEGVAGWAKLEGDTLGLAVQKFAERGFRNDHKIYAMLFDLHGLDVVRIVEGHE